MQLEFVKQVQDTEIYRNKFGKTKNVYFYVNKSKGTVVCKKINCKYTVTDILYDLGIHEIDDKVSLNDLYLKDEYVGKAKCHSEDTFDFNIGIEVAQQKMLYNYYKDMDKVVRNALSIVNDIREVILRLWSNTFNQMSKAEEKLGLKE